MTAVLAIVADCLRIHLDVPMPDDNTWARITGWCEALNSARTSIDRILLEASDLGMTVRLDRPQEADWKFSLAQFGRTWKASRTFEQVYPREESR